MASSLIWALGTCSAQPSALRRRSVTVSVVEFPQESSAAIGMLENPPPSAAVVKRYAPSNQRHSLRLPHSLSRLGASRMCWNPTREKGSFSSFSLSCRNRSLGRRKSGGSVPSALTIYCLLCISPLDLFYASRSSPFALINSTKCSLCLFWFIRQFLDLVWGRNGYWSELDLEAMKDSKVHIVGKFGDFIQYSIFWSYPSVNWSVFGKPKKVACLGSNAWRSVAPVGFAVRVDMLFMEVWWQRFIVLSRMRDLIMTTKGRNIWWLPFDMALYFMLFILRNSFTSWYRHHIA